MRGVRPLAPAPDPESLLSPMCRADRNPASHNLCTGERFMDDQPCYCRCHFPDHAVTWECHHGVPIPSEDRPAMPQKHPWSYTAQWWQRRVK